MSLCVREEEETAGHGAGRGVVGHTAARTRVCGRGGGLPTHAAGRSQRRAQAGALGLLRALAPCAHGWACAFVACVRAPHACTHR